MAPTAAMLFLGYHHCKTTPTTHYPNPNTLITSTTNFSTTAAAAAAAVVTASAATSAAIASFFSSKASKFGASRLFSRRSELGTATEEVTDRVASTCAPSLEDKFEESLQFSCWS